MAIVCYQRSYVLADVTWANDELLKCMAYLLADAAGYLVATLYLDRVLPQAWGVAASPLFCLTEWPCCQRRQRGGNTKATVPDGVDMLDSDVASEFRRVAKGNYEPTAPVQLFNLRKEFGSKVAVDNVSLVVETHEAFGLLGPNGAGKTTVIGVIMGLLSPSHGTGRIAGFDIRSSMRSIHQVIGVCPQHDIVYPSLVCFLPRVVVSCQANFRSCLWCTSPASCGASAALC